MHTCKIILMILQVWWFY